MFRRILVPVDGSTVGFQALDQALQIAAREGAVITALCVIDVRVLNEARIYLPMDEEVKASDEIVSPSKATLTYQAWARQVTARAQGQGESIGVEVRTEIVTGVPYQEIISRSPAHDLLVMGAWGTWRDYPGPFLAGSTLWRVVAHTHLPTLCMQGQRREVQTILVAYDDSREARDVLQLTATWSRAWGLTLVVLTVQPDGNRAQALLRKARARVHPTIPRLVARDGDPTEAILTIAAKYHCDLIALGVRAGQPALRRSPGNLTQALLRASPLPMLLSH